MSLLKVPVSYGEVLDKITILEIKSERIADEAKLKNIHRELDELNRTWAESGLDHPELPRLKNSLKAVNEALWEIEDAIRVKESRREFDEEFIRLARSVYVENDQRAAVKKDINVLLGSDLVEEKSYNTTMSRVTRSMTPGYSSLVPQGRAAAGFPLNFLAAWS